MLRWGIVAPGRIAGTFAWALRNLPGHQLTRVAGRDLGRAQAFALRYGAQASPDVAALCADPAVDIVYVASPHSAHAEHCRVALAAGKPVLCEKSLTPGAASAAALLAEARERKLFLMEAVWSRFQPAWQRIHALLRDGAIGAVQRVSSSFCFTVPYDPHSRAFDPALAGGALLDIGIYNLNLTQWVMEAGGQGRLRGHHIQGRLAPTGVEQSVEGCLEFEGGASAAFACRFDGQSDNSLLIEGSGGWIRIPAGFWAAQGFRWQGEGAAQAQDEHHPFACNGMEYEAMACAEALREGWLEHPVMPHADTLATLDLIDAMTHQLGAKRP